MTKAFTLSQPITRKIDGEEVEIAELELRRIKGKDCRDADNCDTITQSLEVLMERITGLSRRELDELDGSDYYALKEEVVDFVKKRKA